MIYQIKVHYGVCKCLLLYCCHFKGLYTEHFLRRHDDVMTWKHIPHCWPCVWDSINYLWIIGPESHSLLKSVLSAWRSSSWWCYQMETFSALLALCAGNSPVTGEFPPQRPVTWSFDVSLICAWINGWVNNHDAGDLRCHHAHYDVTVMFEQALHIWWMRHFNAHLTSLLW